MTPFISVEGHKIFRLKKRR